MKEAFAGTIILLIMGTILIGCLNMPCPNNDDQKCYNNISGLVCNGAVRCPTGACGTCQYPGLLNEPCAETPDCAEGYLCDTEVSGLCKGDQGTSCETDEDCYQVSICDETCN